MESVLRMKQNPEAMKKKEIKEEGMKKLYTMEKKII